MKFARKPMLGLLLLAGLSGGALAATATPPTLEELQAAASGKAASKTEQTEEISLRMKAVQEAAQSYGMRGGLLYRSAQIRASLDRAANDLDVVWNFGPLMIIDLQPGEDPRTMRGRYIVPPVITRAQQIFKQDNANLIRLVDQTYRIESQARFSPTLPTWRTYLYRNLGEETPGLPHGSLLPRNDGEKGKWNDWVAAGYAEGIEQANQYFEYDLNRLTRDYTGMVLYHELVLQRMVSLPYVATANLGVTGDGETLNINDVVLRITAIPGFQHDTSTWTPIAR
jgi:defect-in-organelle-trafficking protein DotC